MIRNAFGQQYDVPQMMLFYPKLKEEFFFCWALSKIWGQNYWGNYDRMWWQNDPTKVELTLPWEGTHEEYLGDVFNWEASHEDVFAVRDNIFCDVAVLFSKQSRDNLSGEDGYYHREWLGWTQLLMRNNILFEQVLDSDLIAEKLEKYRLLILPNAACLSTEQVNAIKAFVAEGGTIISTYETSLYDEQGEKSTDFALADVFGVNYVRNIPDINPPVVMHSGTAIEQQSNLSSSGRIFPASTSLTVKPQDGVDVHAHLDTYNPSFEAPSIMVNQHGDGKANIFWI